MTDAAPDKEGLKTLFSIVVIIGSAAVLFFRLVGLPPKIDALPHVGIGEALAEQAVQALGSGGRIILIAPDTSVFRYPGFEIQLKTFFKAIRKANLSVSATNLIKLDPLRLVRVPPDDFVSLLNKRSEADVIVSLLGPPLPTPEQKAKLPPKHARVVAICSGDMPRQVNLRALFDENLLHAAIVSRPSPPISVPQTSDVAAWFKHFYLVITPANLGELPAP